MTAGSTRRLALLIALALTGTAHADEPTAQFRLADRDTPHVGVPFHLDLRIEGFDEAPQPSAGKLEIANAEVSFVTAQPNVSRAWILANVPLKIDADRIHYLEGFRRAGLE